MSKIGIFYGSTTGNTEDIAVQIQEAFDNEADLYNIASSSIDEMSEYSFLIFGISSWGLGDMQDDWDRIKDKLEQFDFTGRKVAIFGLGDQGNYPDRFADAVATLASIVERNGAELVGKTNPDGYSFSESRAVRNGKFIGLVLDVDSQRERTRERIIHWVHRLKRIDQL